MLPFALLAVCMLALAGGVLRCAAVPASRRRAWLAWLRAAAGGGHDGGRGKEDDGEQLWAGMRVDGAGGGGAVSVFLDGGSDRIRRRGGRERAGALTPARIARRA